MTAAPATSQRPGPAATITLLLVSTLTIMAGATISPALPKLQAHFAAIPQAKLLVELLLTIPAAAIALTAPVAGWLSDRVGRHLLLVAAILLYAAAGTSGLWLDGLPALLFGRVLLGVAVGGVMATATALIGDLFKGPDRARLLGWQAAATSFGGVVFLLAGGALADTGWRGPFAVYAVSLVLAPLAFLFLRTGSHTAPPIAKLDASGDVELGVPAALGWAALAAFAGAAFYLVPTRLPFRLEEIGAESGLLSGAGVGATVLASGLASLMAGRLAKVMSRPLIVGLGLLLLGLGLVAVGVLGSYVAILLSLAVAGIGTGILQPTLIGLALDATSDGARGRISGLMTSAMFAGQFASPFLSAPIEAHADLASAYRLIGFVCASGGLLFGGTMIVRGRRPAPGSSIQAKATL